MSEIRARATTVERLHEVERERRRQDDEWGEQDHPDGTALYVRTYAAMAHKEYDRATANKTLTWRHILDEEVCEAFAETDPAKLRAELIQVAAVAVAWIEAIDRRGA